MSTLYNGLVAGNMPANILRQIRASRQNFSLTHATESILLSGYRKDATLTVEAKKETGINDLEYSDLYNIKLSVPDYLFTSARLKNAYLLMKEPNNVSAKVAFRTGSPEYINLVNDASVDPTAPTQTSLAALNINAEVSSTTSQIEYIWTAGVTPLQAQQIGALSASAASGGAGGTGSSMTAIANTKADRKIAGIRGCVIGSGGVLNGSGDVGELTSEACKLAFTGVVNGDRKSYADLEFCGALKFNALIETMQSRLTVETVQSLIDEATEVPGFITCQSGLKVQWEAGAVSIVPSFFYGDMQGHLQLSINGMINFNSDEASPDCIDFSTPGTILLKKLL